MEQKTDSTGFRLAITKDWALKRFVKSTDSSTVLKQDIDVHNYLRKKLTNASAGRVAIERPAKSARIIIHSVRPGVVTGKKSEDTEILERDPWALMGVPVHVNTEEIRRPELDAQVIAGDITQQLEKRIQFRRTIKRAMQNAMRSGAKGTRIIISGRLNGVDTARNEWYREGHVPLHTLHADVDYATSEAHTIYGVPGLKVWVYIEDNIRSPRPEYEEKQRKTGGCSATANQTEISQTTKKP